VIPLTPEQHAAAHAEGAEVAVTAGAGTGKTRVLTARYLHLTLERGVEPRRILALTFTEKAARQMKDRIRAALRAEGRPDLARAAEFAPISTIHSFLARTLRERALDADLDPRFAMADEGLAELLLEEAAAEAVDAMPPALRATLSELRGGEETLLDLHGAARATPHAIPSLRPMEFDGTELVRRTLRFLDAIEGIRAAGRSGERVRALLPLRARLERLDPVAGAEFQALTKGNVSAELRPHFQEARAFAGDWAGIALLDRTRALGAAVREALARIDDAYARRKRADALLDFADLEREGHRLLLGPAGAEVAREFDHLLVDEYQDTSRIQEAILDALARGRTRFGVGDAKQSIYRFRFADSSVFDRLVARAPRRRLSGCFRSRPDLVSFTNRLFRTLFEGSGVEPQDLVAEAAFREKALPSVELLAPHAANAADGRRREATLLARRIAAIVEGKELRITRADRPDEPIGYRHCAILVRTTTGLPVYERALAAAGIPYVVVKGRGYYAAREVVDLAHLLLLLHDPADRYRTAAVLTSLLCGVPDGDLLRLPELRLPLPAGDPPPGIPGARWERLSRFSRRFESWRADYGRLPTGDLVERILRETRFAELLLAEADGRRRHANLKKALRRARACAEDPATFARELLEFRERERRESEAAIASERDEAVKVMTVHAAKGLEFPLVAVADLSARRRQGGGPILRPDGTFGFRLDAEELAPPGLAPLLEAEAREESDEALRLLYVALTRAEEHLLLCGALTPRGEQAILRPLLDLPEVRVESPPRGEGPRLPRPAGYAGAVRGALRRMAPVPPEVPRDEAGARALLARIASIRRPPIDETPYVVAAADLVEFARSPERYRLVRALGIDVDAAFAEPPEEGEGPERDEHPARTLGTAFHAIVAESGLAARPSRADLDRYLPGATDRDRAKLARWCAWLAAQPLLRALPPEGARRELPFVARIEGLAVRGVIDLYHPNGPAGPLLADYKTSREARPEPYAVQMSVYLAALRAIGLPAPPVAHLLFVDAEESLAVEPVPLAPLVEAFLRFGRVGGSPDPATRG